jgi:diguanylate cyclase (GGDEF)-like protein
MHALAQAISRLTENRNRGALNRCTLELIGACSPARSLELYYCVGSSPSLRLLLTARADGGVATSIPTPDVTLSELPVVESVPLFGVALRENRPVREDSQGRMVFPVELGNRFVALLDLKADAPLDQAVAILIQSLLKIYSNQLALLEFGETDSLTGLLNRKTYDASFFERGKASAAQVQLSPAQTERREMATQLWLGVIDIDHFKRVNDMHGHLIGDEILLLVARQLRSSFRYGDDLFRFGGEEFVVLLRAPGREQARVAFERFRTGLHANEFPRVGHITASVGFTAIGQSDLPSSAFDRADRAVYFAKQHGRDQVRCFEDLLESGDLESAKHESAVELF